MNKQVGLLVFVIIILVAALMYLLGQRSVQATGSDPVTAEPEVEESAAPPSSPATQAPTPTATAVAQANGDPSLARPLIQNPTPGLSVQPCIVMLQINDRLQPGSGYASIRSGPSSNAPEIDRLPVGKQVFACTRNEGEWLGVIYPEENIVLGRPDICGNRVLYPGEQYSGSCPSGWIHLDDLEHVPN